MHAVDTNVLVRLLVRDDAAQVAAAERDVADDAVWVAHVVLVETCWVLEAVYHRTRAQIAAAVEVLLGHEKVVFEDTAVVVGALAHFRKRGRVDFADAVVLALAEKAGALPLATFDRGLARLPGTRRLGGR